MTKNKTNSPEQKSESKQLEFQPINGKKVTVSFDETELTSDAGLLALAQMQSSAELIKKFASSISDSRDKPLHSLKTLLTQRIYQVLSGNPDANDSDRMRYDASLQTIAGSESDLASQPTMSRLENSISIKDCIRLSYVLGDFFLDSFKQAPEAMVVDMDPTAHLVYGQQELGLFNTHVGDTCLMPFHVYEGLTGRLITTIMRPGKTPVASEIITVMKRIIMKIRERYPETKLIFRADSHHTKPDVMEFLEQEGVEWITGLSPNKRLNEQFSQVRKDAVAAYERNKKERKDDAAVVRYGSGFYKAGSWSDSQRVICRVIAGPNGVDSRYIVTSFHTASAKYLYETVYCGRGEAELFIKDHKLGLESDRSPCASAVANQFRLLLHSAAYSLLHHFRQEVLKGSELAKSTFCQIRLKLFKVAARVQRMKTRIKFHLPENFKYQNIFTKVAEALSPVPE